MGDLSLAYKAGDADEEYGVLVKLFNDYKEEFNNYLKSLPEAEWLLDVLEDRLDFYSIQREKLNY